MKPSHEHQALGLFNVTAAKVRETRVLQLFSFSSASIYLAYF